MDVSSYLRTRGTRIVGRQRGELVSPSYDFKWRQWRARMEAQRVPHRTQDLLVPRVLRVTSDPSR